MFGVDGEGSDDLAGGGVDDSDVVAGDEKDDGGSVEGSSESDVVNVAVDAQADASAVDAVASDAMVGAGSQRATNLLTHEGATSQVGPLPTVNALQQRQQ